MRYTLTIRDEDYNEIKEHLIREDKNERVVFALCGRSFVENAEDRMLIKRIIKLDESQLILSTPTQVSWDNNEFIKVLKLAELKDYGIVIFHNHSNGLNKFSDADDLGEHNLFKLAYNRNGGNRPHGSVIMLPDGSLIGRVWKRDLSNDEFDIIRVIGNSFKIWYPDRLNNYQSPEIFHRQKLAFGPALVQDFSKLKITVVGAGATGSATAMLLNRLGIGEIFIIDKDKIEESNLNRLEYATINDVGKSKVEVLKKYIDNTGLNTKVTAINDWVSAPDAIKSLKVSDVVFGCTDDNAGRIILNRFAYFYLTPVIDMGLVISMKKDSYEIQDLQGRVSFIFPGSDCMLTKGIINSDIAYAENLKREDPDNYEKLKEEAYVIGEKNPSPAVVTFTTQIATLAVNELLNRIQTFNPNAIKPHKIYMFHRGIELSPKNREDNDCRICGNKLYWARGDMKPFLDIVI